MADSSKAQQILGWLPRIHFKALIRIMVDTDLVRAGLPATGEAKRILEEHFEDWHRWASQVVSMDPTH